MINLMDVTEGSCKYNDGVECLVRNECTKCGWNPAVHAKRVAKLQAMNEEGAFLNLKELIANGETIGISV